MLKRAESCSSKPRSKGCKAAKKCVAKDRAFCKKHVNSQNFRCHRLVAMETMIGGASGVSRLARDLLRRCGGKRLTREEIIRVRRVLSRKYIADGEGDMVLHTLQKCDLTRQELLQLQRVMRTYVVNRSASIIRSRNRKTLRAMRNLKLRMKEVSSKSFLTKIRREVGNGDAVRDHWVKKITEEAKTYDACASVKCPDDSFCRLGACWKKENYFKFDPCKGVSCGNGKECKEGICVWRTSCAGVTCPRGERCLHGQCLDRESCYGE